MRYFQIFNKTKKTKLCEYSHFTHLPHLHPLGSPLLQPLTLPGKVENSTVTGIHRACRFLPSVIGTDGQPSRIVKLMQINLFSMSQPFLISAPSQTKQILLHVLGLCPCQHHGERSCSNPLFSKVMSNTYCFIVCFVAQTFFTE
jgi:hypothetical protein